MTGVTAVPECPGWICSDGFGQDDPLTVELATPNSGYQYRANLSLDLVSQTTTGGGVAEQDRARLRLLRAQIHAARVERRHMLQAARRQCRDARGSLQDRQRTERHALVERQRS